MRFSVATSPRPSTFAPLVFAGRLDEALDCIARAGFGGVEISVRHANDVDAGWLRQRLDETGLAVSAFACGRLCLEESICLCDARPQIRAMVLAELEAIISLAASFDAPVIIGGVRGKLSGDGLQMQEQRLAAVETLRKCTTLAEELGINLFLEPINRYETNFINSAQDGMELIREVGSPVFKLLLDTFHMNIEEADLCESIRKAGPLLGYVHFADSNRLAPGQGHTDFLAVTRAIAETGFTGFITAEILPLPDDATAVTQTGEFIRTKLGQQELFKI